MKEALSEAEISRRLNEALAKTSVRAACPPGLKQAAVLVPLLRSPEGWELLFTRRTRAVEHHKGQVSFPGGRRDEDDPDAQATALREAQEEIGLAPGDVRLLGRLNDLATITRYCVTPVVGAIPAGYSFQPSPSEVSRVFSIPLAWLADESNRIRTSFTPEGARRPVPVTVYRSYDHEVLWGISAQITLELIRALGLG